MSIYPIGSLFLIDSIQAALVQNKDTADDFVSTKIFDEEHDHVEDETDMMSDHHELDARGVRLPSESILLGKRRLPQESILLGKRRLPTESILLGKRRLPNESILLGKRRLPNESILLGKRRLPNESILLGKRRLPNEAVLLGRRDSTNEGSASAERR
jgi:hypothetical protein